MAQNTTASNTQQEKNPQSDGTIIYIPPVLFRPFGTDKTVPPELKDSKTLLNALWHEGMLVRGNKRAERVEWMHHKHAEDKDRDYWKEDWS